MKTLKMSRLQKSLETPQVSDDTASSAEELLLKNFDRLISDYEIPLLDLSEVIAMQERFNSLTRSISTCSSIWFSDEVSLNQVYEKLENAKMVQRRIL